MKNLFLSILFTLLFSVICSAQDTRLNITQMPQPERPKAYNTLDVQGTLLLSVEFLEYGEIGEVTAVKPLPHGLTELGIAAARKIKFEPEKKDGKPVTVIRNVQYNYSWNGGWSIPEDKSAKPVAVGDPKKAEEIIKKAVDLLGGTKYLNVQTQIGRGRFSILKDGVILSFQSFLDVIVFPDTERTDFKGGGTRSSQVNVGDSGWIYDGDMEKITDQTEAQIANFKRGMRTSLDTLLRGKWRNEAELAYLGTRQAGLGKRNDVIRIEYKDGFSVEFEFAADTGMPAKAIHTRLDSEGEEAREEDRYAQFIDVDGIKTPFIIDRFTNGKQSSRINFESVRFNASLPNSIFAKPTNLKELKKDLKL